jgi:hypothetical protein
MQYIFHSVYAREVVPENSSRNTPPAREEIEAGINTP